MADHSSKGAVVAAVGVNVTLTVLKFIGFALSGSGAMFAEAMHSGADAANQFLLYLGIARSEKPANEMFHYGFGYERFLFALLSAAGIFVLGCGVTVYHGIHTLMDPHEIKFSWFSIVVLIISLVLDAWVLWKAVQVVNKQRGDVPFFQFLRTTSDPTVIAVLFEDCVACVGVLIAMLGIAVSLFLPAHLSYWPDAISSIVIGLLLGYVAIWLGMKNSKLILGLAIPKADEDAMVALIKSQPTVENVRAVQSRVLGSDAYKLKVEVDFNGRVLAERLFEWLETQDVINKGTAEHTPEQRKDFLRDFSERLMQEHGKEINRIEDELRKQFPELKFIDIETD